MIVALLLTGYTSFTQKQQQKTTTTNNNKKQQFKNQKLIANENVCNRKRDTQRG